MKQFSISFLFLLLVTLSQTGNAQYCVLPAPSPWPPESYYDNCMGSKYINDFILTGEESSSINDPATGCPGNGYEDRTSLPPVKLYRGFAYKAFVSNLAIEFTIPNGSRCAIWIDFNDNYVFENSERVAAHNDPIYNTSFTTGDSVELIIPASVPAGIHRMRVMMADLMDFEYEPLYAEDYDPCNLNADHFWSSGEAHDYLVNILNSDTICAPPTTSSVTNITDNSAVINWDDSGAYILEYGLAGFIPGTGATAGTGGTIISPANAPQEITGLLQDNHYKVYIRRVCTDGSTATYSTNKETSFYTRPGNDLCSGAIELSEANPTYSGRTNYAINDTVISTTCGSEPVVCRGVWFKTTATYNGTLNVKICTDMEHDDFFYGNNIRIFEGSCGTLHSCKKNHPMDNCYSTYSEFLGANITIPVVKDSTYYILFGGTEYIGPSGFIGYGLYTIKAELTSDALPISSSELKGSVNADDNPQLSWTTYTEHNNKGFYIQRSFNSTDFENIAWLDSKAEGGNSKQPIDYVYVDQNSGQDNGVLYRTVQVDWDGKESISNTVYINGHNKLNSFTITPNPANNNIRISLGQNKNINGNIQIYDMSGKLLKSTKVNQVISEVDISDLRQGLYIIKYSDHMTTVAAKLIKE